MYFHLTFLPFLSFSVLHAGAPCWWMKSWSCEDHDVHQPLSVCARGGGGFLWKLLFLRGAPFPPRHGKFSVCVCVCVRNTYCAALFLQAAGGQRTGWKWSLATRFLLNVHCAHFQTCKTLSPLLMLSRKNFLFLMCTVYLSDCVVRCSFQTTLSWN